MNQKQAQRKGLIAPPDLVTAEEAARRRAVIHGWTFKIKDQYDVPFTNHCMAYIKGYRDDPPAEYTDGHAAERES